jgi:hypothetical protein
MSTRSSDERSPWRVLGGLAAVGALSVLGVAQVSAADSAPHKVTLCHATDSTSNPYVLITVDYHGAMNGHAGHAGPLFSPDTASQGWGDVIPPFDFGPDGTFAGMNWTADGQAILANGCVAVPTTTTGGGG